MAVYVITGKLGSGKTLVSVGKIKEYLLSGRVVASNLDIDLKDMLGKNHKKSVYYRIPDKPNIDDLNNIGIGNDSYNEEKNGLLVLDECGTWFNSRSWADKSRQDVINWFLHARKKGWDIIFLIQDLSIMDKQARVALAEHVVYCRRTDRLNVPIVGGLFKFFSGGRLKFPKVHIGIVRYGDLPSSVIVDKWFYRGRDLYNSYDTKQVFSDSYQDGVFHLLPPYYSHGRYYIQKGLGFYMRLTKIHWRRFSRPFMLIFGFILGLFLMGSYDLFSISHLKSRVNKIQQASHKVDSKSKFDLTGAVITSYSRFSDNFEYIIKLPNETIISSTKLLNNNYTLISGGPCSLTVDSGDSYEIINCI